MDADEANTPYLGWHLDERERGREVWYSLVTDTEGEVAFWYRYTLLSTEGGHQEARLWAGLTGTDDDFFGTRRYALSDARFEGPFALSFGKDGEDGDARLTSSSARGALEVDGRDVSWSFEYEPDDVVFTPLRSEKLTDMAEEYLGSGRHWSANESVRMDGTLEVDGRTYTFEDAPGHQGHTVGRSAPESWSWLHCNSFDGAAASDEARGACVEVLGTEGMTTLCFRRGGEAHMLNRMQHLIGPTANETTENRPGKWKIRAKGEGIKVEIWVETGDEETDWKKAAYMTPDDTSRYVAHSSLASVQVTYRVEEDDGWSEQRTLDSEAARVEWGRTSPPVGERDEYRPKEFA